MATTPLQEANRQLRVARLQLFAVLTTITGAEERTGGSASLDQLAETKALLIQASEKCQRAKEFVDGAYVQLNTHLGEQGTLPLPLFEEETEEETEEYEE